jgi:hypothetical protein
MRLNRSFPKCLTLFSICTWGLLITSAALYADDNVASEKVLQIISEQKEHGFLHVRGERRGFLSSQGILKQRIKLLANQSYLVVVAGDDDMEDLNIIVQDPKGNEVKRSSGKGQSFLDFTPSKKSRFKLIIEAPQRGGYYHFSLLTK